MREQIRAITGHTIASINEVLDRYTKLTADQAGAALERRLAHEKGTVRKLFDRSTSVKRRENEALVESDQNVSRELFQKNIH